MKEWTNEQAELLRKLYQQKMSLKQIAVILGHPTRSVANKAYELELKKKHHMFTKNWTEEEDNLLKAIYPSQSRTEILQQIHRPWYCITNRVYWLNQAYRLELRRSQAAIMSERLTTAREGLNALSETDKAYLAGIIDGEGSVGISKYHNKQSGKDFYVTYVAITNTSISLWKWLDTHIFRAMDIHRNLIPQDMGHFGKKPCYKVTLGTKKSHLLLEAILPYLVIKKERAELVIQFAKVRLAKAFQAPQGKEEAEILDRMTQLRQKQL